MCRGKVVPAHAMKTYKGCRGIAPLVSKFRHLLEVSGHLHALATEPPGKNPATTEQEWEWVLKPVWTFLEISCPCWDSNTGPSSPYLVAIPAPLLSQKPAFPLFTEQSRLQIDCLAYINTLRTGDADLRFYVTTVQDG